jgi:hypothetical protein
MHLKGECEMAQRAHFALVKRRPTSAAPAFPLVRFQVYDCTDMALCPRCNKRAAKRVCPALEAKICAVCCAQDRMLEIACPESCHYLRSGRESAIEREREFLAKSFAATGKHALLDKRHVSAINLIEHAIVATQRQSMRDLSDAEILAAIENVIKNLETEESGLIYEHQSPSARVQELSRSIRKGLNEAAQQMTTENRLRRSEMLEALRYLQVVLQAHLSQGEDARSYLRYTAQFYPWLQEKTDPIILIP